MVSPSLGCGFDLLDDPEADTVPITLPHESEKDGEQAPTAQLVQRPRISTFGLNNTFAIPDGRTALISGWKREHGVRTESGLPVLSDIPYLGKLFTNSGYTREKECVLMLVTPRIIVVEEQEERKTPYQP